MSHARTALRTRLRRLHVEEDGLSGGAEALVFGVLVFVIGTIIVLNGWAVLDAKFAVSAAAREATRTIVEQSGSRPEMVGYADGAVTTGTAYDVAVETLSGYGKDPAALDDPSAFQVVLAEDPWSSATGLPGRCQRVTVEVRYPVESIELPFVGGWQTPIDAVGQHTEIIDPFRSGLTGRADCG